MAEDLGQRPEAKASWTKLFMAFRVALDVKKLLLAGAGILAMSLGWWVLAMVFYGARSKPEPVPDYVTPALTEAKEPDVKAIEQAWKSFRVARLRWNFLHKLAGRPGSNVAIDEGDVAESYEDYEQLKRWKEAIHNAQAPLQIVYDGDKKEYFLTFEKQRFLITAADAKVLDKLDKQKVHFDEIRLGDPKEQAVFIGGALVKVDKYDDLRRLRDTARSIAQIAMEAQGHPQKSQLFKKLDALIGRPTFKPAGLLRTMPWFEDRGPNPYLVATDVITEGRSLVGPQSPFLSWGRALLEPLAKMLSPILYFFDDGAGGWNRIYLIGVILWTLAVWGFFGGAITRMAAVQVARGEKVSLREAVQFARERCQSYFSAPVFPLIFLGVLTFFLILFGLFSGLIPILGDIFISGFMWPIVLILGLVMAVVLVGLVGWPMMNATISSEGSDSFDALSRSYSYVYQAPWHYLWYGVVSLVYGAALIFFVGLMGSLMVYLGSWGIRQAPFLAGTVENDRQPHFLFVSAPTSFGWRDLLLHDSPFAKRVPVTNNRGQIEMHYAMDADYVQSMTWYNWIGAYLVNFWLFAFFLLIVGFGYSYFWTASTIIYLLMRNKVDDTDLDEIHLEEDETDDYFAKDMTAPAPMAPAPTPAAPVPGGGVMVDAPTLRSSAPAPSATPAATPTTPSEASANEPPPGNNEPPTGHS